MSFWTNKKVIVTGGRGLIGSHLVDRLLTEGATVRGVDLRSRNRPELPRRAEYHKADPPPNAAGFRRNFGVFFSLQ